MNNGRKKRRLQDCSEEDEVVIVQLQPTAKHYSSSDEEDGVEMSIEGAFQKAGQFGWFQIRLLLFMLLYHIPASFHILAISFVGLSSKWECAEKTNSIYYQSNESIINDCDLYDIPNTNCSPVYTDRFYSIAQEWNLICDESYKISLTQSGFFLGFLCGSFVLGSLGDWFGRRIVTILFLIFLTIIQVMIALSPNYYLFALGRFLIGFFIPGGTTTFILLCEVTDPSKRSLLAVSQATVFAIGYGVMALFAFLLPNWRWFTASIAIMTSVLIFLTRYVPESPRWLLVNGKEMEAKKALADIARINGRSLPSGFSLMVPPKPSKSFNIVQLFRYRKIRTNMLILMLEWFTVCMVYYGLSLGVGSLSSNLYLAFTLSGLVEIPSNLLTLVALEKIGRRWSNVGFLFIGGVAGLACSFVQFTEIDSSGYIQLGLSLLGKFSVSASFSVIYTYTPELLPTDLRNSGMGIVNVCARLGGILAPLILLLDIHVAGLSMLIMGSLGALTSVICVFLPETLNQPLPNTIAELNKTYKR